MSSASLFLYSSPWGAKEGGGREGGVEVRWETNWGQIDFLLSHWNVVEEMEDGLLELGIIRVHHREERQNSYCFLEDTLRFLVLIPLLVILAILEDDVWSFGAPGVGGGWVGGPKPFSPWPGTPRCEITSHLQSSKKIVKYVRIFTFKGQYS